jgi:hypothetical protein
MENLDLWESFGHSDRGSNESFDNYTATYFTTQSGGVSDSNEGTRRLEGKYTTSVHQMCVIITEAAEDDNGRNNPVINSQGDNPRNTHRKEREKVYVSAGEWKMIKSAVNHGMTVPADSRREVLMGYQYALHQHKKQLLHEESELRRNYESNNAANKTQWEEHSDTSQTSEERHYEPKHNRGREKRPGVEYHMQNLRSTFSTADEVASIIPDTPEAALVVAQAYMLTTQPEPRDPRESMHQAVIKGLGLIGDKLKQDPLEKNTTRNELKEKRSRRSQTPQTRRSSPPSKRHYRSRGEDARNIITQARVNRSRCEWDDGNYEDEEK